MFEDLAYTQLALRLVKKIGRRDITAMPLELAFPSTVGMAMAVMAPAYLSLNRELGDSKMAAQMTWFIGIDRHHSVDSCHQDDRRVCRLLDYEAIACTASGPPLDDPITGVNSLTASPWAHCRPGREPS